MTQYVLTDIIDHNLNLAIRISHSMLTYDQVKEELAYYFQQNQTIDKLVIHQTLADFNQEQETTDFITIEKHEDGYLIKFADERFYEVLTDDSFDNQHKLLGFLYPHLKKYNDNNRYNFIQRLFRQDSQHPAAGTVADYQYNPRKTYKDYLLTPFKWINSFLKLTVNFFLLDNFISKYLVGTVIAKIANHGNPHYQIDAHSIKKTLGPLIFSGGFTKPTIWDDGNIYLGPVLSLQLNGFRNFQKNENDQVSRTPFKVELRRGIVLDGVETTVNQTNDLLVLDDEIDENPSDYLHIIHFNGNSGCYEDDAHLIEKDVLAYWKDEKKVKAIQFNYPGVLNSTGKVKNAGDLVESGIAQIERLNKQFNVPYEKIALCGVSLGGSIAVHVASYYQSRGIRLAGTYARKTFSNTTNVAISYIQRVPYIGKVLGFILRPIISFGLWGTGWQLNTAAHYANLPANQREYSFVRSTRQLRRDNPDYKDDRVIDDFASLHESWVNKLLNFVHKRGWFNFNRNTYKGLNQGRKMSVHVKNDDEDSLVYTPELGGHVPGFNPDLSPEQPILLHRNHENLAIPSADNENVQLMESSQKARLFFSQPNQRRGLTFWQPQVEEQAEESCSSKLFRSVLSHIC